MIRPPPLHEDLGVKRLLLLLPLALLAGCGGSSDGMAGGTPSSSSPAAMSSDGVVTVDTTDDFRFVPDKVSAKAGTVRILLTNSGSYPHNLAIRDLGFTSKTVTGAPGSNRAELAFTVDKPGEYRFICTFHDQAGMVGTLTVTP